MSMIGPHDMRARWGSTSRGRSGLCRALAVAASLSSPQLWAQGHTPGAWHSGGVLTTARFAHSATRLPDGRVLVVGGRDPSGAGALSSAERFERLTATWTTVGAMSTPRAFHTATTLPNGKVLIVGGAGALDVPTASAELYDPVSATFSPAGSMSTPRAHHAASLLPNGQVLVSGGFDGNGYLASAELYDPATDTFAPTAGLMNAMRASEAVPLPGGLVLLVGEINPPEGFTDSAELFRPGLGVFEATDFPMTARGGVQNLLRLSNGKVLLAGGPGDSGTALASAALYDPVSENFTGTGSLVTARRAHGSALLPNGRALVSGGWNAENGSVLSSAEIYDPASETFSETGALDAARAYHTSTLLPDGHVLVVGGTSEASLESSALASAEIYCPEVSGATGTWRPVVSTLSYARHSHAALVASDGSVAIVGGSAAGSVESFSPESETFSPAGTLSGGGGERSAAALMTSGLILVAGGAQGDASDEITLYDPRTENASSYVIEKGALPGGRLAALRVFHTVSSLADGRGLIAGGAVDAYGTYFADLFSPNLSPCDVSEAAACGILTELGGAEVPFMVRPRWLHTATLLPDGRVLVTGGFDDETELPTNAAELFDPGLPAGGSFVPTGAMATRRVGHSATLLPNGLVLVAAGRDENGATLGSAELYDPVSGSWSVTSDLIRARAEHSASTMANGLVLFSGGEDDNGDPLSEVEVYDPRLGLFGRAPSLTTPRSRHSSTLLANGLILVVGGNGPGGTTTDSAELYAAPLCGSPAIAPANLTAQAAPTREGAIELAWEPSPDSSILEQRIYRGTGSGGAFALAAVVPDNLTAIHTDAGLEDGVTYHYVVRGVAGGLETADSNETSAMASSVTLEPPSALSAVDAPDDTGGTVTLAWTPSASVEAVGQFVWRSQTSGGPYSLVTTIADNVTSAYQDSGLVDGVPYFYVVSSYDGSHESVRSGEATTVPRDNRPWGDESWVLTDEDVSREITVSGSDPDGDPVTFSLAALPAHGVVTGELPTVTYTPALDFNGLDSFTFTVNDRSLSSVETLVIVQVFPVNDPPHFDPIPDQTVAEDSGEGTILITSISGGPSTALDEQSQPIWMDVETEDSSLLRDLFISGDAEAQTLHFAPAPDAYGAATIRVTAVDGGHATMHSFLLTVDPVNDPPIAINGAIELEWTPSSSVGAIEQRLYRRQSPVDPLKLIQTFQDNTTHTFMDDGNTALRYYYVVTAANGDSESPHSNEVDGFPSARTIEASEDSQVGVTLQAFDADPDPLTFQIASPPSNGTLTGTAPNLTYIPDSGFSGNDELTFTVSDGVLVSEPATLPIVVVPVNHAPTVQNISLVTEKDTPIVVRVGKDLDNDPLTVSLVSEPANGVLTGTAHALTYVPNPGVHGKDDFTITVNDGALTSNEATISIEVRGPGSTPFTIFETADDGATDGWFVYDTSPPGALVQNVFDDARQSRVIELVGSGIANGYRLGTADESPWHHQSAFFIEWDMAFQENFVIYVEVETTDGRRFLTYTPVDLDALGEQDYVHHGLGADALDGSWRTVVRDLRADLAAAQPELAILEVNGFLVRGNGRIDDVRLSTELPRTDYEDGEDGTTNRWSVYDTTPAGAAIENVFDDSRQSRAIELSGGGISNGYRLGIADGSPWRNKSAFFVEWSMSFLESVVVYVEVETSAGRRFLTYTAADQDALGDQDYVHHALGSGVLDGRWRTIARDLRADLADAQPELTILAVNGFLVRGSGRIDDVRLSGEMPRIEYENGEEQTTDGWVIYDNSPAGAHIDNLYDPERASRVIELGGAGTDNGYRLGVRGGGAWHDKNQFVLEWTMAFSESFIVYVDVKTDVGRRFLTYTAVDVDGLGAGEYVHHGVGSSVLDGQWRTFVRDLRDDLSQAQPTLQLLEVNGFLIRGNGRLDDIETR